MPEPWPDHIPNEGPISPQVPKVLPISEESTTAERESRGRGRTQEDIALGRKVQRQRQIDHIARVLSSHFTFDDSERVREVAGDLLVGIEAEYELVRRGVLDSMRRRTGEHDG